jgi:hypothetical protein
VGPRRRNDPTNIGRLGGYTSTVPLSVDASARRSAARGDIGEREQSMLESSASSPVEGRAVRPVPQRIEANEEPSRPPAESALLRELRSLSEQVTLLAPDCVGMSVTWTEYQRPFTLVASEPGIAVLDALQYLGGGPAPEVVARQQGLEAEVGSLLNENSWRLFARAALARGVRSILALPLTHHGRVAGTVTFHGASRHAFDGAHEELTSAVAAWAPDAIRLADAGRPSPPTEDRPRTLRDEGMINRAIATIATARDRDAVATKELLDDAAARAGVSPAQVAEVLLQAHH